MRRQHPRNLYGCSRRSIDAAIRYLGNAWRLRAERPALASRSWATCLIAARTSRSSHAAGMGCNGRGGPSGGAGSRRRRIEERRHISDCNSGARGIGRGRRADQQCVRPRTDAPRSAGRHGLRGPRRRRLATNVLGPFRLTKAFLGFAGYIRARNRRGAGGQYLERCRCERVPAMGRVTGASKERFTT